MIAVDTNILIRFFIRDDERQFTLVNNLFKKAEDEKDSIFISDIVLVEFVWVLKRGYSIPKVKIIDTLNAIGSNNIFTFQNKFRFKKALKGFRGNSGDFADYLIGQTGYENRAITTYTFDKKIRNSAFFTILK